MRVIAQRTDQLGGRLEGLLCSWRFARAIGRETVIHWPPRGPNYEIASILDVNGITRSGLSNDISFSGRKFAGAPDCHELIKTPGWPFQLNRDLIHNVDKDIWIGANLHNSVILFEGENEAEVHHEKIALFKLLAINSKILDSLQNLILKIGTDFLAVHIRRGDIVQSLRKRIDTVKAGMSDGMIETELNLHRGEMSNWIGHFVRRAADLDAYFSATKAEASALDRIVVFSDSPEEAERFMEKLDFGEPLLISSFQNNLTALQQALLEILVMMNARTVISTDSNFGKFACKYGRPRFVDARFFAGAGRSRELFWEVFGDLVQESEHLRADCSRLLERKLKTDALLSASYAAERVSL